MSSGPYPGTLPTEFSLSPSKFKMGKQFFGSFLGRVSAQSQHEAATEDRLSPPWVLFMMKRDQGHLGGKLSRKDRWENWENINKY
jgi:hypothetical protein